VRVRIPQDAARFLGIDGRPAWSLHERHDGDWTTTADPDGAAGDGIALPDLQPLSAKMIEIRAAALRLSITSAWTR
jgi:hypothetical protein